MSQQVLYKNFVEKSHERRKNSWKFVDILTKQCEKKSSNLTKFLSKTCWDILYNELVIFLLAIFVEQYVLTTAVPKFQHIFFHQFNIFLRVNSLIVQVSAVRRPKINDVRANFVVYETILKHCMLATTRWMVLEKLEHYHEALSKILAPNWSLDKALFGISVFVSYHRKICHFPVFANQKSRLSM